jgi:hypothetical protein
MVSFKKFLVKHHLVVLGFLLFILMFFLTPIYGTTDDFILDSWLNGTYTGDFERDSIFISSYASNFFSLLYTLNNVVPWYSLILLILNYISVIYIITQIKKNENISVSNYIILLTLIFFFLIWSYIRITYTATGIILAIAGLISFYYSIKQVNKKLRFSAVFFSFLAFAIRPESLIAAVVFFYPIFIFSFYNHKAFKKKSLILLGSIFFIYGLNWFIESNQQDEFKEFRTWSKEVQSFAGRPTMEIVARNIGNSGWTTSEYNSFKDLTYFDPKIFNDKWIDSGLALTKNYYFKPNLALNNVVTIIGNIYSSFGIFIISFLYIFLFFYQKYDKNKKIIIFLSINFILMNFLLGLYFQNVARVSVPIVIGLIIFLATISGKTTNKYAIAILSFVTITYLTFSIYNLNSENIQKKLRNTNNTNFININFANNIILIHGNQEFAQFSNPYHLNKVDSNPNVFMVGNWDTFSPHWYKRADNLGINGKDLTNELINNEKILWTAPSIPDTTFNLKNLLKEQGYGEVDAVRIESLPDGNDIRKFSLKE